MSEDNFTMAIISNFLKYKVYLHDYKEFTKQYGTYNYSFITQENT